MPSPSAVESLPLTGDFQYVYAPLPGYPCGLPNTLNGIAVASKNREVAGCEQHGDRPTVPVRSRHWRVQADSDLDRSVQHAAIPDGLLLHGSTLYSVENLLNQIAVMDCRTTSSYCDDRDIHHLAEFDVPSTAASSGNSIYAVNARFRFDGSTPPQADDDIVKVSR